MPDPAADGLIHVADYQWVTSDMTTPSAQVERALGEALDLVEDELGRDLAYAEHTETLEVARNGRVYPTHTPVGAVSVPTVDAAALQRGGIYVGSGRWNLGGLWGWGASGLTVTYSGGFQPFGASDAVTPALPTTLMRAICRVAWLILHPVVLSGVPAGAKSASVGDVSVAGDLSAFVAVDSSIERDIKGYRKRRRVTSRG